MDESTVDIMEMSKDALDALMAELDLEAKTLGFDNMDRYNEWKFDASEGLQMFGGSFASLIGRAMCVADSQNMFKIVKQWRGMLTEHAELYRLFIQRKNLENCS